LATAILSNGSPAMLAAAIAHAGLGDLIDQVLSVEEAVVYKPHSRVYQLAVDRLAVPPREIAFISSNGWDAWAGSAYGMRAIWCNRQSEARERLPGAPDREIRVLSELPPLVIA
jgi:2-haloacid dehalogenase